MSLWNQHFESYPALDNQKRIFDLVTKLWEQRDAIAAKFLQLPPYDSHYNNDRIKENVAFLLQSYVSEFTNIFKPVEKADGEEDAEE